MGLASPTEGDVGDWHEFIELFLLTRMSLIFPEFGEGDDDESDVCDNCSNVGVTGDERDEDEVMGDDLDDVDIVGDNCDSEESVLSEDGDNFGGGENTLLDRKCAIDNEDWNDGFTSFSGDFGTGEPASLQIIGEDA